MADLIYTVEVALGGTLTDVTNLVEGFVCSYGRRREFEAFPAGSCQFTIEDRTGDYVPNGGGVWSSETWIGREVRVTASSNTGRVLWVGTVDDIDVEVAGFFEARVDVSAVGPLAQIGRTEIADGETFPSELSSTRVDSVLALPEVGFGGSTDVSLGETTLQADSDAGGNALAYLQKVARSEGGLLFVRDQGTVTFRPRSSTSRASGVTFTDESAGSADTLYDGGTAETATFSRTFDGGDSASSMSDALDGGTAAAEFLSTVPYEQVGFGFGSDSLYNRVVYTRDGGTAQAADNTDSQTRFGVRTVSETGLLNVDDTDVLELAELRLARQSSPSRSVESLTVLLDTMSAAQADVTLGLSVGDLVKVVTSPPGYLTNGTLISSARVEQVQHRVSTASHSMRLRLTSLSDEFGRIVDGGDATTSSFDTTYDGGDASSAVFVGALDGGDATYS